MPWPLQDTKRSLALHLAVRLRIKGTTRSRTIRRTAKQKRTKCTHGINRRPRHIMWVSGGKNIVTKVTQINYNNMKRNPKTRYGTPPTGSNTPSSNKLGKKLIALCRRLPDVRHFVINLSEYDQIFRKYGLSRRLKYKLKHHKSIIALGMRENTPGTIHIVPYKNKAMNKYLKHQSNRLNANRSNPWLFW
jgi:hypothetical protein